LRSTSTTAFALASILTSIAASSSAYADATVNVVLQDATSGGDMTGMKMTATPESIISGRVTIHATNQSQGLVHEVIVVRPPANGAKLPYDDRPASSSKSRSKTSGRFPTFRPASRAH
jgi:uncharacterized cupredoxin-like copper-binding protein